MHILCLHDCVLFRVLPGRNSCKSGPAVRGVLIALGAAGLCLLWIRLHWGNIWRLLWAFTEQHFSRGHLEPQLVDFDISSDTSSSTSLHSCDQAHITRPSFVHKGTGPLQGAQVCDSACRRWATLSIILPLLPLRAEQRMRKCLYLPSTAGTCCVGPNVDCSEVFDVKHALVLHIVMLSLVCRCPSSVSYLLFLSRPLTNNDIWSKMNATVKSECQYRHCGQTKWASACVSLHGNHPSNERLARHIVCRRNGRF